jgi:hypothetical protein
VLRPILPTIACLCEHCCIADACCPAHLRGGAFPLQGLPPLDAYGLDQGCEGGQFPVIIAQGEGDDHRDGGSGVREGEEWIAAEAFFSGGAESGGVNDSFAAAIRLPEGGDGGSDTYSDLGNFDWVTPNEGAARAVCCGCLCCGRLTCPTPLPLHPQKPLGLAGARGGDDDDELLLMGQRMLSHRRSPSPSRAATELLLPRQRRRRRLRHRSSNRRARAVYANRDTVRLSSTRALQLRHEAAQQVCMLPRWQTDRQTDRQTAARRSSY